jgi:hypothetical protein
MRSLLVAKGHPPKWRDESVIVFQVPPAARSVRVSRLGVLALLAVALPAQAAPDYFLGTWKANPVKTKLSPGTPEVRKSEVMIVDDMGLDQYRVTRITQDGKNSTVGLYFDGRERFSDPATGVIGVKLGPRSYRNTIKGAKGTLVSEWIVSPDGKELTNTRKGTGAETGRVINEVLVYDLQPNKENQKSSLPRK